MIRYVLRRLLYAIPTLIGVLALTWFLFFGTASPDVIARRNLSSRNPTQEQIRGWLKDHGYDKPPLEQLKKSTVQMLLFDFGKSDSSKEEIKDRVRGGALASAAVASNIFFFELATALLLAIVAAYFRGTYIDSATTAFCVFLMSIVVMVYVIGFQFVFGKLLHLGPIWGFERGASLIKYIVVPAITGVVAGVATEIRLYRTFLLDEINLDYVRTARAKGVSEQAILFRHVLKNAMIPILTNTVTTIPFLILGGLVIENFFGIPGLGSYLVDAIGANDFAVVRAMVFLGTLLYILGLILTDIAYALVDPRVRLE